MRRRSRSFSAAARIRVPCLAASIIPMPGRPFAGEDVVAAHLDVVGLEPSMKRGSMSVATTAPPGRPCWPACARPAPRLPHLETVASSNSARPRADETSTGREGPATVPAVRVQCWPPLTRARSGASGRSNRMWHLRPSSCRVSALSERPDQLAGRPGDRACSRRILRSAVAMACRASSTASGFTEIEVMPKRTRCSANSGRFEGA